MTFSTLPIRRVESDTRATLPDAWPARIPAVAQLLTDGLDLGPLTVLVGENGTGKSTIVEALARAYGLNTSGGSPHALPEGERPDDSPLADALRVVRGAGASKWGFFLRAETMYGWFATMAAEGMLRDSHDYLRLSHGESFHEFLASKRFTGPGLYLFDEPESALSFTAQLALIGQLHELAARGSSQVVLSTHSPVLAAIPGARVLELGDWGWRESTWDDLELVDHWRRFTQAPDAYLRHVIDAQ